MDIFLGRTYKDLCPIAAILLYMLQRGPGIGFLFRFADGKPLTRPILVSRIREAISQVEVSCDPYSGHTFQIGVATTAAWQEIKKYWKGRRVARTNYT